MKWVVNVRRKLWPTASGNEEFNFKTRVTILINGLDNYVLQPCAVTVDSLDGRERDRDWAGLS
jgi:hypothetical protein